MSQLASVPSALQRQSFLFSNQSLSNRPSVGLEPNKPHQSSDPDLEQHATLLLARLIHDMNNALMVITGNAELALLELSTAWSVKIALEPMLDAIHQAQELNTQLLNHTDVRCGVSAKK